MAELRERMTLSEFREWLEYLMWEEERHSKADYYMAQVAAEVRRGFVKNPKRVRLRDFLLQFPGRPKTNEDRMYRSKKAWAAVLKIDIERD